MTRATSPADLPPSRFARLTAWTRKHPRMTGVGIIVASLVLLSVAVILSWTLFSDRPQVGQIEATPSATPAQTSLASARPSASPTPTESSASEPTGTPAPSLDYEAPEGILPPGSRVVVVVDLLQLRDKPGIDGPVVGTAPLGAQYFAIFPGPMQVDGISWARLLALEGGYSAWAASGSGADRYLELVPPECPSADPDLATLATMLAWDRLACFGNRSLTIEGTYGCPVCGGDHLGSYEPPWLAHPEALNQLWVEYPPISSVEIYLPPDSGLTFPKLGSVMRVTGHFSDPVSTSCSITTGDPLLVDATAAELHCREHFVVDAMEVTGTDPNYADPYGG